MTIGFCTCQNTSWHSELSFRRGEILSQQSPPSEEAGHCHHIICNHYWGLQTGCCGQEQLWRWGREGRENSNCLRTITERVLKANSDFRISGQLSCIERNFSKAGTASALATGDVHLHQLVGGDRVTMSNGNSTSSPTISLASSLSTQVPLSARAAPPKRRWKLSFAPSNVHMKPGHLQPRGGQDSPQVIWDLEDLRRERRLIMVSWK